MEHTSQAGLRKQNYNNNVFKAYKTAKKSLNTVFTLPYFTLHMKVLWHETK
jgi:hypothetical protein